MIDAAMKRDARQAWLAAQYTAFSYHQPDEMPDDPAKDEETGPSDADAIYVRAHLRALAEGNINGS